MVNNSGQTGLSLVSFVIQLTYLISLSMPSLYYLLLTLLEILWHLWSKNLWKEFWGPHTTDSTVIISSEVTFLRSVPGEWQPVSQCLKPRLDVLLLLHPPTSPSSHLSQALTPHVNFPPQSSKLPSRPTYITMIASWPNLCTSKPDCRRICFPHCHQQNLSLTKMKLSWFSFKSYKDSLFTYINGSQFFQMTLSLGFIINVRNVHNALLKQNL